MAEQRKVCKTAVYVVSADKLGIVMPALEVFVREVKKKEPGVVTYEVFQSKDDPTRFMHFMIFKDSKAEQKHTDTKHVRKYTEILYPNCEKEPVFSDFDLVE